MESLFDVISVLDSPPARRNWLLENYPAVDYPFIQRLQEEAHRIESDDRRKARMIAQVVADAALLWGDPQTLAAALRMEAQSLRTVDPQTALHKYQEAIRIYNELGQHLLGAEAAVGLVATLRMLGRYDEALTTNQGVIHHLRAADEKLGVARALLNQGLITYFLGRFEEARGYYAESHALFAELGQQQWCAAVKSNDANVLEELNQFELAEAQYKAARAYYVEAHMDNAVARIDHNLAYLRFSLGDYQAALQIFAAAREQFAAQESFIDIAFVDLYRSEIYLAFNLWRKAFSLAQSAREIFESAKMPWETAQLLLNEAVALLNLDSSELALGKLQQARRLFTQAGFEHWQAVVDFCEAQSYWRLQEYERATNSAQQAYAIFQKFGLTRRLVQCETLLGQIAFANGQIESAATHFAAAQASAGPYELPAVTYRYHIGWARVHRLRGKFEEAYSHYEQALTFIEQQQTKIGAEDYKTAFLNDKIEIYEEFIQFCLDQKRAETREMAFAVFERAKLIVQSAEQTLEWRDGMGRRNERIQAKNQANESELDGQIRQLRRELNRYYTQFHTPEANFATVADATRLNKMIVQCEQQLSELLDTQRHLDLAAANGASITSTNLTTIQADLPPTTLLLEYFVTNEQVTIFCVEHNRFAVYQAPVTVDQLLDLWQLLNFQIGKFHLGAYFRERHQRLLQNSIDEVLGQLYTLLIAPFSELLQDCEQIVVAPHHVLYNLPFHAFFNGEKYLLETHDVVYTQSASFHHVVRQSLANKSLRPGLILGLSDMFIEQAEEEAVAIAEVFPGAELRLGVDATTDLMLHNEYPRAFMHLATHGVFRTDNSLFSALKLADGWLTLQELKDVSCTAPLITLSACDSGRSETLLGDKLIGFYQSFFNAGAQSVVASLWALDDQVAIETMKAFYKAVENGDAVHHALRNAQLQLMSSRRHPYYWAPFMLVGNPDLTISQRGTTDDTL